MNLTVEQIETAKAGKPVRIELPGGGAIYLLMEDLFQQMLSLLQSEPEQEAFRKFSMRQAQRIASENSR